MCNCNDEPKCININMGCVTPIVANADAYYTKSEIDEKLEDIVTSGCCITPQEVDDKISSAITGYATEDYVSGYTYDKQTIDEKVASGGTFDPTQYYNKTQTNALLDNKLDVSAYTPTDLSNYYTKTEVDEKIPSLSGYATEQWVEDKGYLTEHQPLKTINGETLVGSGDIVITSSTTDLSNYYNKQDIDEMLDDEATKTWVNDNYVTISELLQYVNNLQEQITSLQSSISGCCGGGGSGETIYRWITMTGVNDYVCSGTTKMSKEKKQQSTDNGITWSDVSPLETRTGGIVLEENCVDCGYGACVTLSAYTQNDVIIPNAHEQESGKLTVSTTRQGNMATYSTEITAVTISDCITEIGTPNGYGVFTWSDSSINYTNLVSVIIPSSVTLIRPNSFKTKYQGICNLRTVIVRATTPPTMSNSYEYFSTDAGLTIYVPIESLDAYRTANGWRRYADIIQPIT